MEDGVKVCSTSKTCPDCQGIDANEDCSGGGKWRFHVNEVYYTSKKYGKEYHMIFPQTAREQYQCGKSSDPHVPIPASNLSQRLTARCLGIVIAVFSCYHTTYSGTEGPCKKSKPREIGWGADPRGIAENATEVEEARRRVRHVPIGTA